MNNPTQIQQYLTNFIKQNNFEFIGEQHEKIKQLKNIVTDSKPNPDKLFVAEGIWAQQKILETNTVVPALFICPEFIYTDEAVEILKKLTQHCTQHFVISEKIFKKLSERDKPDGFLTLAKLPTCEIEKFSPPSNAVILILDGIEIPGNIGTMLRMCDGAGVDALFICNRRARLTNPKLIKGSMGAVLTVPIFEFETVENCQKWLFENNFTTYLADTRAKKHYFEENFKVKTAIVMGSERYGISKQWYDKNAVLISIPMLGKCDSLNVSVAATVITYQATLKNKFEA